MNRRDLLKGGLVVSANLMLSATLPLPSNAGNLRGKRPKSPRLVRDDYTTSLEISGDDYRYRWKHNDLDIDIKFQPKSGFVTSDARRRLMRLNHTESTRLYRIIAENDPYRKAFISPFVEAVARKATRMRIDPAELLLSFVQGLPNKPEVGYQAWATETMLQVHGDCSDTSVLYAALLEQFQARRYRCIGGAPLWCFLIGARNESHMAVGVRERPGFLILEPIGNTKDIDTLLPKRQAPDGRMVNAPRARYVPPRLPFREAGGELRCFPSCAAGSAGCRVWRSSVSCPGRQSGRILRGTKARRRA